MCVHPVICPRRWTFTSSSGLPANSGMKCNQFSCGIWDDWIGHVGIGCAGGTTGCMGGAGSCTGEVGGMTGGGWCAGSSGGPPSAMFTYNTIHVVNIFFLILNVSLIKMLLAIDIYFYKNCELIFYYWLS